MVHTCVAEGCRKRKNPGTPESFYRFPRNEPRRGMWIAAVKRSGWQPTDCSRLCSGHFISGKKSDNPLSPDYVPSVFSHVSSPLKRKRHGDFEKFQQRQKVKSRRKDQAKTGYDAVGALHNVKPMASGSIPALGTVAGASEDPVEMDNRHINDGEHIESETMMPSTSKRGCVSTSEHSGGVLQDSHGAGDSEGDGNPPMTGVVGFSMETTLALLPRMYMEELLSELDRRNIVVKLSGGNRPRGRDDLELVLKEVMMKEYEEWEGVSDADEDMSNNGSSFEQTSPGDRGSSQAEDCSIGGTPSCHTYSAAVQVKKEPGEEDREHCVAASTSVQKRHTVYTEPSTSHTGHSGLGDGSQSNLARAPTHTCMVKIKREPGVEEQSGEQLGITSVEPGVEEQPEEEQDVQPSYSVEPSVEEQAEKELGNSVQPSVEEQLEEQQDDSMEPSYSVEPSVEEQLEEQQEDSMEPSYSVDVSSDLDVAETSGASSPNSTITGRKKAPRLCSQNSITLRATTPRCCDSDKLFNELNRLFRQEQKVNDLVCSAVELRADAMYRSCLIQVELTRDNGHGYFICPWPSCRYGRRARHEVASHIRKLHLGPNLCPECGHVTKSLPAMQRHQKKNRHTNRAVETLFHRFQNAAVRRYCSDLFEEFFIPFSGDDQQ